MLVVAMLVGALLSGSVASAIGVTDGGSILNGFEVVDHWQANRGHPHNIYALAAVPEANGVSLYANLRNVGMAQLTPAYVPGGSMYAVGSSRTDGSHSSNTGLTYDPVYSGGAVLNSYLYMPQSKGFTGGTDGIIATAEGDNSDVPLSTPSPGGSANRYSNEVCYVPAQYTWNNKDGYFLVNRTLNAIRQFEVNPTPDPDQLVGSVLPGRAAGEFTENLVMDIASELGNSGIRAVQFAEYPTTGALYLTVGVGSNSIPGASNSNQLITETHALIAITPGADGKFGPNASGVNDDEAIGYQLGEPGAANNGNTGKVERQHITSEAAPGDTTLIDIDGDYGAGWGASAYDFVNGLLYVHGTGDGGEGAVLRDISFRSAPPAPVAEPAGLSLLGLTLLGLKRRKRS
jgi:hypothetical protein